MASSLTPVRVTPEREADYIDRLRMEVLHNLSESLQQLSPLLAIEVVRGAILGREKIPRKPNKARLLALAAHNGDGERRGVERIILIMKLENRRRWRRVSRLSQRRRGS